jgi:acyl-CoA synthetase (AMP-forming)/AMP-acid ligase II
MVSHKNVIANVLQVATYDSYARKKKGIQTEVGLGLMPFSHIYGLIVVSHIAPWRGDEIIVLPKFDLDMYLKSIQKFKIERLTIVCYSDLVGQEVLPSLTCIGSANYYTHVAVTRHLQQI